MKRILSLFLALAMLCTGAFAMTGCANSDKIVDNINYEIDLNSKPELKVLMPNSGKSIDAVNSDKTALLIESLTGYKTTYTQLPADATTTLNTILMDKEAYDVIKLNKDQFSDLVKKDMPKKKCILMI